MNDTEREDAFHQVEAAMNEAGLSWVTNQVNEEIRFGKVLTKTVVSAGEPSEELIFERLARVRQSKIEVSATRPYTGAERLEILLSALERALPGTEECKMPSESAYRRRQRRNGSPCG